MKIIKRNGTEAEFDASKIIAAINKAANEVSPRELNGAQVAEIANNIKIFAENTNRALGVEEIQEFVETGIMEAGGYETAKKYIKYRYQHSLKRELTKTDESILSLLDSKNEELKQENSNKNVHIIPTQRDYMAGEESKRLCREVLIPEDILAAHDDGRIHCHDMDYISMRMHNCDLVNLEDMLQNGTKISGIPIESPKSFAVACNVATQIIAQVASSQYGGQSITLSHLAPFVDVSRKKIRNEIINTTENLGINVSDKQIDEWTEKRLAKEIKDGVQTLQYQLITLMTTNGQTPFVTMFMYIDEVPEGRVRDDLILIIKEVLKQRIQGIKDETGHYMTIAFPKLIYVLEPDNLPGGQYEDVTMLAAQCSAKRMVPDYISEKKIKEIKNGNVFPCMGCVTGDEVIAYKLFDATYVESFKRAWARTGQYYKTQAQANGKDLYRDTPDMSIWDSEKQAFVKCHRLIRNASDEWMELTFSNGRILDCTPDHPFETNHGIKKACELSADDIIKADKTFTATGDNAFNSDRAWLMGFMLCDGCYDKHVSASVAISGEEDIKDKFVNVLKNEFGYNVAVKEEHRGKKGNYLSLNVIKDDSYNIQELANYFIVKFEGIQKKDRHIPNEVFGWNKEAKLAFLAGMIDADGHINNNLKLSKVQVGSVNRELAEQQMLLAESLGMPASIYRNHYASNANIRYAVEFVPADDLVNQIASAKKRSHMTNNVRTNNSVSTSNDIWLTNCERHCYADFSYDVTTESEHFTVAGIYSHNCRSFLTVEDSVRNADGTHKFYGRFNQGVCTVNLVDAACASGGDMDSFWKILDETLELCHRFLQLRHERLVGTVSDVAPILWQDGALARLKPGETIDKLLYGGYSTISLGYAGLYECVYYMTGYSHTGEGREFAMQVMQHLNDKCAEWRAEENIAYSVYGTPMESTTYKFAKCLQKKYGIIPEVTDHNYITNSYHVNVREKIDAFDKLALEAEFQKLSPGGAISYVEVPNLEKNPEAVMSLLQYIYDTIMYAEINTRSDYCMKCGYEGEIGLENQDGKLIWKCPCCGNTDEKTMQVVRRTCGYIGSQYWNQGRTAEIRDRVIHLSPEACE